MFTSGIIGPPGSKYSKFGVSETNFEVLAIKSIGKSLKFSPHIKKYHDFQNMILKSDVWISKSICLLTFRETCNL